MIRKPPGSRASLAASAVAAASACGGVAPSAMATPIDHARRDRSVLRRDRLDDGRQQAVGDSGGILFVVQVLGDDHQRPRCDPGDGVGRAQTLAEPVHAAVHGPGLDVIGVVIAVPASSSSQRRRAKGESLWPERRAAEASTISRPRRFGSPVLASVVSAVGLPYPATRSLRVAASLVGPVMSDAQRRSGLAPADVGSSDGRGADRMARTDLRPSDDRPRRSGSCSSTAPRTAAPSATSPTIARSAGGRRPSANVRSDPTSSLRWDVRTPGRRQRWPRSRGSGRRAGPPAPRRDRAPPGQLRARSRRRPGSLIPRLAGARHGVNIVSSSHLRVGHDGWMPMRQDCKFFESRTYANGETVRKCDLDLAPEAPWRCPDGVPWPSNAAWRT